tara:strand:+ start:147 stop:419 length:273 start_codon:yes stop_codon:yes gene_type:complete
MGKMKEKFMEEQEHLIRQAVESFVDDDYQYQEYLNTLGKSLSQEEAQSNHDDWWNSLTDEEKQKLYEETEAAEQDRIDNDINGPNNQYGV